MNAQGGHGAVFRLDHGDSRVMAAREAEQTAYQYYGVEYEEHFLELSDVESRLRLIETGTGPPLVLISGGEGMGYRMFPLLSELQNFTVYLMDRPGGGLSDGIDALETPGVHDHLDELGTVERIVVQCQNHARDAAIFSERYTVPVHLPVWMNRAANRFEAQTERFQAPSGEWVELGEILRGR